MWIPIAIAAGSARTRWSVLCTAFLPLYYVSKKRNKRIDALETQLPDALDFLSRSMRAGHAFTISLEMVGEEIHEPLGQEFRALFNEQNLGASLERSFLNFSKRVPIPDVRFFCFRRAAAAPDRRQSERNSEPPVAHHPRTIPAEGTSESGERPRTAHGHDSDAAADRNTGRTDAHVSRVISTR